MALNKQNARGLLKDFAFTKLFVEELGWDRHNAALPLQLGEMTYSLKAVAEKRGMVAWHCDMPSGSTMPSRETRRRIETQVAKSNFEHFIIFTDSKRSEQIWCWAKRETGKPAAMPEHLWHATSGNAGFLQKLEAIAFSLEEEERLSLLDVTSRARSGFDVERVTKRFYDQFKTEHKAFLSLIAGIPPDCDEKGKPKRDKDGNLIEPEKEWYASLMLNRMMFIYFMQRKGFLNGERDYLRERLVRCQTENGKDKYYSFYRYFLLRLFHEGLGGKSRNAELEKLLGHIPYLNGGLFEKHQIEERYPDIQIPDKAFSRVFDYFDRYQWHLDERPLRNDNEINPDVLGYIFEKYINQKQMGAYYTKEDITEYISKNTIIPFLFDAAKAKCKVAFENPGGPTVWDHLREDPDRYIYKAVRHGCENPLPAEIAAGVKDVAARGSWNRAAPEEFALPTEIWREVVARRTRHAEVRAKLAAGEVREINDLITLNLDVRQFAQDVIERCEGPDLLRAFWKAIEAVTVLDPTCGSGAFLFAALNILEPLYETCLERMEAFVADLDRSATGHSPKKFDDFRATLTNVSAHANTRYFILKSIILNNLFGVDIMEEAVEICKLRLFLKLAAQVEPDSTHPNLGIEPLPDIDFNVRAGNTLIGYATFAEVEASASGDWVKQQELELIRPRAADLQQAFDAFRTRQVEGDGTVPTDDKVELRKRLKALEDVLNLQLAKSYGVKTTDSRAFSAWKHSHQPFHWFVEFHGILSGGGFDVILGNPPFVEYSKVRNQYGIQNMTTEKCNNLYAFVVERSINILAVGGRSGLIVPMAAITSRRTQEMRKLLASTASFLYASSYAGDAHPSVLFEGVRLRISFIIFNRMPRSQTFSLMTTIFQRWYASERSILFERLEYGATRLAFLWDVVPRIGAREGAEIWNKVFSQRTGFSIGTHLGTGASVFYQEAAQYFVKATVELPYFHKNGAICAPPHGRKINCNRDQAPIVMAVLSSSLFYYWYHAISDCYHVSDAVVQAFPCQETVFTDVVLARIGQQLERKLHSNAKRVSIKTKAGDMIEYDAFNYQSVKSVLDEIDVRLAGHFNLNSRELEYIRNYDGKYRLGRDAESDTTVEGE